MRSTFSINTIAFLTLATAWVSAQQSTTPVPKPPANANFNRVVRSAGYCPHEILRVHSSAASRLSPPQPLSIDLQMKHLGLPPNSAVVFIPGYYFWTGERYLWIDPIWSVPPVSGAVWISSKWIYQEQDSYWVLQEGYWREAPGDTETLSWPSSCGSLSGADKSMNQLGEKK